jgi:phosphoglycolate phosphatase
LRYRAVLFDFDGTLADSYAAITASINHLRAHIGLPALEESNVRGHVGQGLGHLLEMTVPGMDVETGTTLYRAHHPSVMQSGTRLLPGARALVDFLGERGARQAVCSNKPVVYTKELVHYLKLERWLELVLGPEDVPRIKPAPDMVHKALEHFRIKREDALYIGDMTIDIETARAAGVPVWVVATGSSQRDVLEAARPDRLLGSLHEACTLLRG